MDPGIGSRRPDRRAIRCRPRPNAEVIRLLGADYPFLDVVWTMLIFFAWVIWFWLLITIFGDVFRRRDISGSGKTGWTLFVIFLPYLGVFSYLIAEHQGMAERNLQQVHAAQTQTDEYIKSVAANQG